MWTLGGKDSSFKLGRRRLVRLPARRTGPRPGRRSDDHVRRRRRAAVRALAVARAQAAPEPQAHDRDRGHPARALPAPARELRGRRPGACPTRTTSSAGASSRTSASSTPRASWCSTARFVDSNLTYRAYRFVWNATPATPPSFAVSRHGRKMTVYASWNGATGVAALARVRRQPARPSCPRWRPRAKQRVRDRDHRPRPALRGRRGARRQGPLRSPASAVQQVPVAPLATNRFLAGVDGIVTRIPAACAGGSDPRPSPFTAIRCRSCSWTGFWSRSLTTSLSG